MNLTITRLLPDAELGLSEAQYHVCDQATGQRGTFRANGSKIRGELSLAPALVARLIERQKLP